MSVTQSSKRTSGRGRGSVRVARGRSRRSPSLPQWQVDSGQWPVANGQHSRARAGLVVALVLAVLTAWPVLAATDMQGRTVAVPSPARRVVSLLPSITETAFALQRGD